MEKAAEEEVNKLKANNIKTKKAKASLPKKKTTDDKKTNITQASEETIDSEPDVKENK